MKTHEIRNGRLIQTNKKFSQLKIKQKEWINTLLREKYIEAYQLKGKNPSKEVRNAILSTVYKAIDEKEIWIPYHEVERYFFSKINSYLKSAKKIENNRDDLK